jgi:anaerobic selenocysteine-containing dehydrogenase
MVPCFASGAAEARPAPGRDRLLSPASAWLMSSSYGNDPGIQAKLGPERIAIHPQDAAKLGLQNGDCVRLENETGRLEVDVEVAALVAPGVLLGSKSRWPKALSGQRQHQRAQSRPQERHGRELGRAWRRGQAGAAWGRRCVFDEGGRAGEVTCDQRRRFFPRPRQGERDAKG